MANVNTPSGFSMLRAGGGGTPYAQQMTLYSIPVSDSTNAYYMGDTVKAANGGDINGISNVVKCTGAAAEAIRGIIMGIYPVQPLIGYPGPSAPLQLEFNYVPTVKLNPWYVMLADDQDAVYVAQDDGVTPGNSIATSCNYNSTYTVVNGATQVSASATVLTSASFAAASPTFPIKLLGLAPFPQGINAFGAYAKWQCRINLSELNGSFNGI